MDHGRFHTKAQARSHHQYAAAHLDGKDQGRKQAMDVIPVQIRHDPDDPTSASSLRKVLHHCRPASCQAAADGEVHTVCLQEVNAKAGKQESSSQ